MKHLLGIAALATATLMASSASAKTIYFTGSFLPGNETKTPVVDGLSPEGGAVFSYDDQTKVLCGRIELYSALTGVPTGVHVHQAPTDNPGGDGAPTNKIVVPIPADAAADALTKADGRVVTFKAVLTDAWATSLMKGEIYGNIHTAKNTDGEIRGSMDMEAEQGALPTPDCTGKPTLALDGTSTTTPPPTEPPTTTPPGGNDGQTDPSPSDGDTGGLKDPDPAPASAKESGCGVTSGRASGVLPAGLLLGIAVAIRGRRKQR